MSLALLRGAALIALMPALAAAQAPAPATTAPTTTAPATATPATPAPATTVADAAAYDFAGATRPAPTYGPRPFYLIDQLPAGALKDKLMSCKDQTPKVTAFSIGHRGAPLMFPEHTVESNLAAAAMGAGVLECDVTFTADRQLVCRHAQNDLHTTTNILSTPLAAKCTTPFTPAANGAEATAECRTSDLTLAEFQTLSPKMDSSDPTATTAEDYQKGNAPFRTDLYTNGAHLMTHAQSIELFRALGAKFTPELKEAIVDMPFDGYTTEDYAQAIVDEYKAAGIPASDVHLQTFEMEHMDHWLKAEPEFAATAVYLVDPDRVQGFDVQKPDTWGEYAPQPLADKGIRTIAPPLFALVAPGTGGDMVPSAYAEAIKAAGMDMISWSLERSGPITPENRGGWYYGSVADVATTDAAVYEIVDTLAQEVGVKGIFSDWPATVTYYANCMGL